MILVLVPPVNISSTMNALTDTSFFEELLERSGSTWESLNNYNNVSNIYKDSSFATEILNEN